jgi:hypothetical protein
MFVSREAILVFDVCSFLIRDQDPEAQRKNTTFMCRRTNWDNFYWGLHRVGLSYARYKMGTLLNSSILFSVTWQLGGVEVVGYGRFERVIL